MAKTPNHLSKLREHLDKAEEDYQKFYEKGNKAAGTRVRKEMQNIKTVAQDIRVHVQDTKNSM